MITLPLGTDGYPSLDALKAAVSDRTAALMVVNPDDMGIYNPHIKQWVEIVHEAGGLAFYDHANFNGVMGRIRARELGFDACMFMLHKTFGAPKGGGGPAAGAYGCADHLAPFLPRPLVTFDGERYTLDVDGPQIVGRVREFLGNIPLVVKAYAWVRAMGGDGIRDAAELSVLANEYMEERLVHVRGLTKLHPQITSRRLEMTRYSLETLTEETGVTWSTCSTAWPTSGSTRRGSATTRGSCRSRSRRRPASLVGRGTSTAGSTCSRTSATRPTRIRSSSGRRRTTRRSTSSTSPASTIRAAGRPPGARTSASAAFRPGPRRCNRMQAAGRFGRSDDTRG